MNKIKSVLKDRLLVRILEGKLYYGKIRIPYGEKRKRGLGFVELIGPDVKDIPIGSFVIFDEHAGFRTEEFKIILNQKDIQALILNYDKNKDNLS